MKCKPVLFTIGCFLAISFTSCKKDDSMQGSPDYGNPNYLVCRVNGVLRKSLGLNNWNRRTGVTYDRYKEGVSFGGDNDIVRDDLGIYIDILPDSVRPDTTYRFGGESNLVHGVYTMFNTNDGTREWEFNTRVNSGWVRFSRIDSAIAIGTFAFTAYRNGQPGADSVVITDGVFSIGAN